MVILRAPEAATLASLVRILVDGGVRCLEVTLTTGGALELIETLVAELPNDVSVGAGSVVTPADARDALIAGAEFLVAPSTNADVIQIGCTAGKPVYPGAWTATEIVQAWEYGAAAVKVFPASVGGPALLRQLKQPLPSIPLLAVGGVTAANAADYLDAGAFAVGVGSSLTDPTLTPNEVLERTELLLATCVPATGAVR